MYFLDTSALLILFLRQPGWEAVRDVIEECTRDSGFLAAADLALTEATVSLHRYHHTGDLTAEERDRILGELGTWMEVKVETLQLGAIDQLHACNLASNHRLRTLDALHLAVGLRARRAFGAVEATFVTLDKEQGMVAGKLGFGSDLT
jgi:predicted nucleic acid-binding protein